MELKNRHIIIFSQMQFDGRLESTNYTMAKHLAKDNYVYYVDRPFTWKDYIKFRDTKEYKIRKPHFFSSTNSYIQTDIPNLKIIISPPVPSINMLPEGVFYRAAVKFNEGIVAKRLKKVIKHLNIKDYIYINSYNYTYPTFHQLIKPVLTVYHCVDPLVEEYQIRHGLISEDIVVKSVDLVICTSKQLRDSKKKLNSNSFFIPNAANITHSQKALDPQLSVAAILADIKKPVIGYFGNIERRIDYDLLTEVLQQNPDKNFVFVGPIDIDYSDHAIFKAPNISLKGAVPYEEMPAVLKGFDVAIIPFKKDGVSNAIFPLKLFEYLGSGRPVVSTDFNIDLREFTGDTVAYCSNANEFSEALNTALNDTSDLQQKRLAIAAENTWEHRILEIENLLALNLDRVSK
ncbi:Glycosyltransferase involved in cell wall bisynthesis [Mucilaginibacter lappiensis]|uniref:Glycosyltransferase involved in cell wall biosynthesis n=1 Tax=Mucilaginibacter lappiensis TaxID=354630 RepID=A0ABR6PHQ6_9SPHI|nr:glycosyltransferase [Mucilaginibacter lappiensis]MBB6109299.1 glycosyltransferase involved in cell wall biosynthesis [Mucilaginibacter lappiensis]SIR01136.1 Glycosyltransferase involved in cell wall bisynthesis [Mucilaginibacter lappiensis]